MKVGDTGCGIAAENLKTIFEPFFTTKGEKGTGIGLWVIKGIIDKVGGEIDLTSSTTGRTGTCFKLLLPATTGDDAQAGERQAEDAGDSSQGKQA